MKAWTLRRTGPGSSMPWEVAFHGQWMGFFATWTEARDFLISSVKDWSSTS